MNPVMLKVLHLGEPRYTGKVFSAPRSSGISRDIFLHQHSATQDHHLFDCPAGIDVVTVFYLMGKGVGEIHIHNTITGEYLWAPTRRIAQKGIRKSFGERDRFYLPREQWEELPNTPRLRSPFIKREMVIDWEDVREEYRGQSRKDTGYANA